MAGTMTWRTADDTDMAFDLLAFVVRIRKFWCENLGQKVNKYSVFINMFKCKVNIGT
jgi:hypothetical protein